MTTNETRTDEDVDDPFTDEQLLTLLAAIQTHPGTDATECEVSLLMNWVESAHMGGLLLEMLLSQELVVVAFGGDEPQFGARQPPQ